MGVTVFVSKILACGKLYKIVPIIIEHGLQGFIVKNIEGESMEANDL